MRVTSDFGANFTFTGGFSFQTLESWKEFIDKGESDVHLQTNNGELYFECDDLDEFIVRLEQRKDIQYVHKLKTHPWGQRGIRIYDPDMHVIEISETLQQVCLRFYHQDITIEDISLKTGLSLKIVSRFLGLK